jgi:FkbM family methyltransferase
VEPGDPDLVATLTVLPRIYRTVLTLTRRHGLRSLATIHHRVIPGARIVSLNGGSRLYVPGDPHYFGFLCGIHERHIERLIQSRLKIGDTCLDVGANIGYFAAMMAGAVGSTGTVYAFEPVPETFEILSINAKLAASSNLNIIPAMKAISSRDGQLSIRRREHSTLNEVMDLIGDGQEGDRVDAVTINTALQAAGCHRAIALGKIDVEGHELSVVSGALPALRAGRIRSLVIEVTPGEDAVAIEGILESCKGRWLCWIDGKWQRMSLKELPYRTDVFVEFHHG